MTNHPPNYWVEPIEFEVDQLDLVNMGQYNVQETKTRLSELLSLVANGEDVVIAKAGRPVVRIVPIAPPAKRRLGFLKLDIPDDAFRDPWTADELGLSDDKLSL